MVKKIYYSELLDMIRNNTNPDYVYYNHRLFTWDSFQRIYVGYDSKGYIVSLLEERVHNVWGTELDISDLGRLLIKFRVDCPVPLLDSTEKKYLYNIVKPYLTNSSIWVIKVLNLDNNSEHLEIGIDFHYSFHT